MYVATTTKAGEGWSHRPLWSGLIDEVRIYNQAVKP